MTTVDRVQKIASQLVGDIGQLPGVTLDTATEAQLVQLVLDAFEQVGVVALEKQELREDGKLYEPPCRCGEYETCSTCIEAHRRFQQANPLVGGAADYIGND